MRAALSVTAVEADEASIDRADVQTIALYRGTAIGEIAVVDIARNAEVDSPELCASLCIERGDRAEGSRQVEAPSHMHWRSLEERSITAGRERFDGIPSVVSPGYGQPVSVIGSRCAPALRARSPWTVPGIAARSFS